MRLKQLWWCDWSSAPPVNQVLLYLSAENSAFVLTQLLLNLADKPDGYCRKLQFLCLTQVSFLIENYYDFVKIYLTYSKISYEKALPYELNMANSMPFLQV